MEEFEYSVDICDQDWTSFMAECEECDLLLPSLAGLDDSGMSDLDDKVRFVQAVEPATDRPRRREDCTADRYLGKRGVAGLESILSGSEEDIHLQSVNVFFERLKSAVEAEKQAEPNHAAPGREVEPEPWQRANGGDLMENSPIGNVLADAGEAAAAEATEANGYSSAVETRGDRDRDGDGVPTSPAAFQSLEPGPVLPGDSSDAEEKAAEQQTPLIIVEEEQFPPGYDASPSLSDSTDAGKAASRESSPSSSSSFRRKRTRKRRPELVLVKPSDSEEDQQERRGGTGVRGQTPSPAFKVPQSGAAAISSLPLRAVRNWSAMVPSRTAASAFSRSGLLATRSHPGGGLHVDQEVIHMFCCENEQQQHRGSSRTLTHLETVTDHNGSGVGQSSDPPSTNSNHGSVSGRERSKSTPDTCDSPPDERRPAPRRPSPDADIPAPELPSFSDSETGGAQMAPAPVPPELLQVRERSSSLSDFTPVWSCCTLDTESGMSLSNGNTTDLSYSSCLTVSQDGSRCSGGKTSPTREEEEEKEVEEVEEVPEADDVTAAPLEEPERAPDSTRSVFAMSSFWSEMEKLTINDILGLRKMEQAASQSCPPPLQERQKPAEFSLTQSGLHADELQPGQTGLPLPEFPRAGAAMTGGTGSDCGSGRTPFRRICKTVSTQDLRALESARSRPEKQALPTLDEEDLERAGCFPDGPPSKKEDGYSVSLGGIFRYILGKKPHPQCYPGNTEGRSLPETYDYFMSDWNTETPSLTAQGRAKGGGRSTGRTLEIPEAYEYFLASSSSDESAVDSDEEDGVSPLRAASRLRRTSTSSELSTDIYDNFFTECDLEQSIFGKNFSFRNLLFPRSSETSRVSGPTVPQTQRGLHVTVNPVGALDNQEWVFSDLQPGEDDLSDLPSQHPLTREDLQVAVPSPRLDAPLLPLRQSDMCLVCIAFASWVLKTANPQVGDAWKAVLLANVSALSAIRYLRKYVKDPPASEQRMLLDS